MSTVDVRATSERMMRSVARVCDLLDALRYEPEGLALDRLAEQVGLPRSSAYRYLLTLERRGYVRRDPRSGLFRLRHAPRQQLPEAFWLRSRAELLPIMAAVRAHWSAEATVGVLVSCQSTFAVTDDGQSPPRRASPCRAVDPRVAHLSAMGRACLVSLPVERMEAVLAQLPGGEAFLGHLTAVRLGRRVIETDAGGTTRITVPVRGLPLGAGLELAIADARATPDLVRAAAWVAQSCADAIYRVWQADRGGH